MGSINPTQNYIGVRAKRLTPDELRACRIPPEHAYFFHVHFTSPEQKLYVADHFTGDHVPFVSVRTSGRARDMDPYDLESAAAVIANITGGHLLGEVNLSMSGRVYEMAARVSLGIRNSPTLPEIAGWVRAYGNHFTLEGTDASFGALAGSEILNSGLPLDKLVFRH